MPDDTWPAIGPPLREHLRLAWSILNGLDAAKRDGDASSHTDSAGVKAFYGTGRQRHDTSPRPLHLPVRLPERQAAGRLDAQQHIISRAIARLISGQPTAIVVELACGTGANTLALASAHPHVRFTGLDLVEAQVVTARAAPGRPANTSFVAADFAQLPLAPGHATVVFSIEGLVYAANMAAALRDVRSVLSHRGELLVIEIFRSAEFGGLPASWRQLARTTERLLAVPPLWGVDDWIQLAADCGFEVAESTDLTAAVLSELRPMAKVGEKMVGSTAGAAVPWLRPVVAGLLTFHSLQASAHRYVAVRLVRHC